MNKQDAEHMGNLIARLDSAQENIGKLYHDIELIKLLVTKLDDNFISKTCGDCACYHEEQDYDDIEYCPHCGAKITKFDKYPDDYDDEDEDE